MVSAKGGKQTTYKVGQIIEGKVTRIQPYGASVSLDSEAQELIHALEVQSGYTRNTHSLLKVRQPITVQIIDIDEYSKKISLSLGTLEKTNSAVSHRRKRYSMNKNRKIGFTTIAEQLPIWIEEMSSELGWKENRK